MCVTCLPGTIIDPNTHLPGINVDEWCCTTADVEKMCGAAADKRYTSATSCTRQITGERAG